MSRELGQGTERFTKANRVLTNGLQAVFRLVSSWWQANFCGVTKPYAIIVCGMCELQSMGTLLRTLPS